MAIHGIQGIAYTRSVEWPENGEEMIPLSVGIDPGHALTGGVKGLS